MVKDVEIICVHQTSSINCSLNKPASKMKSTKLSSQSKQLTRIFVLLAALILWAGNLLAVVPTVDSIKYVESDQANIIVYLSVDVVYTHSDPLPDANWVVYHDGNAYPAVATDNQGGLDPANIVRLKLPDAISFSEAHTGSGITVEFLGGVGLVTNGADDLAAFGPTPAINNLLMKCEIFDPSKFDYSLSLTEVCAPVEIEYTVAYYVKNNYFNSQNYNKYLITIRTFWGDGTSDETYGSEVSPGKFELTFNHLYPADPSVCYWQSYMLPGIGGVGYCSGGGLRKNFTYENHSTDDEGDGVFVFDIDTIRVCLGQDFSEIFTDDTYFNCNPQTEPDFSNDGERYIRFTYPSIRAGVEVTNIYFSHSRLQYIQSLQEHKLQ